MRDSSSDRLLFLGLTGRWQQEHTTVWAEAHILAIFSSCSMFPCWERGHPPCTGTYDVDITPVISILWLLASSCPGTWCILLGVSLACEVLSFADPNSGIPVGVCSWAQFLWETQTHAHTQRRQLRDASRHTQTHMSTHTLAYTLLAPFWDLLFLPNTLLPRKNPNTEHRGYHRLWVGELPRLSTKDKIRVGEQREKDYHTAAKHELCLV